MPPDYDITAYGAVHDITFSNIVIECEGNPIRMDVEEGLALQRLSDITFNTIRARSGKPVLIEGSSETIIERIALQHVHLATSAETAIHTRNCRAIRLQDVTLENLPAGE
jgi:hypothetical protein